MIGSLRQAVGVTIFFFVLLGLLYPLAETGIGQAFFNHNANGSLTANGSTLIGQQWKGPQWFQGRPDGDDPMATGGSNLGPRSKELVQDVKQQATKIAHELPMLAADRKRLGLQSFYYYTWVGNEFHDAPSFNFAGLFRFDGGRFVAKPAFASFRHAALGIERCKVKGPVATACAKRG